MNRAGILLDTGPIVALLSQNDANHDRARALFAECIPPFRCCEAVIAEACFLMRKVHAAGPAEVVALGRRGVYTIALSAAEHWANLETLLKKYADRPISFADACLIRCAEIHHEARILTFDGDFRIYKWARNRKFEFLSTPNPQSRIPPNRPATRHSDRAVRLATQAGRRQSRPRAGSWR